MFIIAILLTLLVLVISGITSVPFLVGLLAVQTILLKKPWVFFLAFGLGLFLDLIMIRPLGYTSLILTIFVFLIRLYERKFEIQTVTFLFISTLLGSMAYLKIFGYQQIFWQSLINSLLAVLFFKFLWLKLDPHLETI